jgi:hypothetical protein
MPSFLFGFFRGMFMLMVIHRMRIISSRIVVAMVMSVMKRVGVDFGARTCRFDTVQCCLLTSLNTTKLIARMIRISIALPTGTVFR